VVVSHVDFHREALKERKRLPAEVALAFAEIEEALLVDHVSATGLAHKREQGWKRRTMLVGEARQGGTTYRMAWEIDDQDVIVWAYGPHEGFYQRLARRARQ
jgi:mRNA-degrading endonuclease RelE of RelBE toxin-antitoxin system